MISQSQAIPKNKFEKYINMAAVLNEELSRIFTNFRILEKKNVCQSRVVVVEIQLQTIDVQCNLEN